MIATMEKPANMLTPAEAAKIKGVSKQTIVNAIQSGALAAEVIHNGARVVHRDDVMARWGSRITNKRDAARWPKYMTVSEIADAVGISKQVAHRAVRSGRVPSIDKPDSDYNSIIYHIRKSDLKNWKASR